MDTIVVDNWYENPDEIREMALSNFREKIEPGNDGYPGSRTFTSVSNLTENLVKLEKVLGKKINEKRWIYNKAINLDMSDFAGICTFDVQENCFRLAETGQHINTEPMDNGQFQYLTKENVPWIHADLAWFRPVNADLAAIIYLTPNPDPHSGTGMYEHKKTKQRRFDLETTKLTEEDYFSDDKWSLVEEIENVYNRCVIWDSQRFHKCIGTFGTDFNNSRLSQVFFFNLE